MAREEISIESWRFTTPSAFVRELTHLLEFSDYKIVAHGKAGRDRATDAGIGFPAGIGQAESEGR
jgi:hypothetical protein